MASEYLQQRPEPCSRPRRRGDLARRVIHRHDQIEWRRSGRQPHVPQGVLVQHHSGQGTTRPLSPVRAATFRLRQQIATLRKSLNPTVALGELMVPYQVLVEKPRRETLVDACPTPDRSADPATRPRLPRRSSGASGRTSAHPRPTSRPPPTGSIPPIPSCRTRRRTSAVLIALLHTNTLAGFRLADPPSLLVGNPLPHRSCAS